MANSSPFYEAAALQHDHDLFCCLWMGYLTSELVNSHSFQNLSCTTLTLVVADIIIHSGPLKSGTAFDCPFSVLLEVFLLLVIALKRTFKCLLESLPKTSIRRLEVKT